LTHGIDLLNQKEILRQYIQNIYDADIRPWVFIDPDIEQVKAAHRIGAMGITLNCHSLTELRTKEDEHSEIQKLVDAAHTASKLGLRVGAGCGITYQTVSQLLPITDIELVIFGHAVVARSLFVGLEHAAREALQSLQS